MPKRPDIKKVLVIGSGPIVIGQAAEFDYAGHAGLPGAARGGHRGRAGELQPGDDHDRHQHGRPRLRRAADRRVRREDHREGAARRPAADAGRADRPEPGDRAGRDGRAGEVRRRAARHAAGVHREGGGPRALQARRCRRSASRCPESVAVHRRMRGVPSRRSSSAHRPARSIIVRPAYTLGGTGGGIAYTWEELREICVRGLRMSHDPPGPGRGALPARLERDRVRGDARRRDNCITICNMENFDPMGIHTGDSIVVAPSQTLTDKEYQMLRTASLKIIRALGIEGGCNVQFALDPKSYPLLRHRGEPAREPLLRAGVQGHRLSHRPRGGEDRRRPAPGRDPQRGDQQTLACFEPALDYVVVKIPRWPFDKFNFADRTSARR